MKSRLYSAISSTFEELWTAYITIFTVQLGIQENSKEEWKHRRFDTVQPPKTASVLIYSIGVV